MEETHTQYIVKVGAQFFRVFQQHKKVYVDEPLSRLGSKMYIFTGMIQIPTLFLKQIKIELTPKIS